MIAPFSAYVVSAVVDCISLSPLFTRSPSGALLRSCSSFFRHCMARGPSTWQKCWSNAPTVSTIWGHHMIICLLCQPQKVWHMVTVYLVFWDLVCGTICQKRSGVVVVCHPSRVHLKHIFSNSRLGFNIISSKYFLVTLNCVVCGYILGELFLILPKSLYVCTTYYPRILFYMCIFLVAMNL